MHTALYSIEQICGALVGVKSIILSDMSNVIGVGPGSLPPAPGSGYSFHDADKIYSIAYERASAALSIASATDEGGDYQTMTLICQVPRGRQEVTRLLSRLRNRPVMIIAIDQYDNQYYLYDARTSWTYSTGDRVPAKNAYSVTFRSICDSVFPIGSGSGEITTAPPLPPGGGGGEDPGSCNISIGHPSISYTPAASGNTMNLGEVVTTPNGSIYFIDCVGRGVLLRTPPARHIRIDLTGLGAVSSVALPIGFPLPDPDDYAAPTYDPIAEISIRVRVEYGSRTLQYLHPEGYDIDTVAHGLTFPEELMEGSLDIYVYENIPPRPL